jgi:probable O-glycosylation ligase (exosortase A-associated)
MKGLIFTYVLSYGGAVISLFSPHFGLLIYICFSIVRPEYTWHWSVPAGNYSRVVAAGLLTGWLLMGLGRWQFGRAGSVVYALIGYWALTAISIAWAINQQTALQAVEVLTKIVLPFLVGITTIDSVRKIKELAWVILLSQAYVAYEANLSYLGGYNRLHEEGFGGMDNNCNAIAFVTCIGLALFLGLETRRWWLRGLAFVSVAFLAHGILISFSRGGMLALIVTGFVSFLLIRKQALHYIILAITVLLLFRLAGPEVVARFGSAFADREHRDGSAGDRVALWQACWDLMLTHPFGIGADQFGNYVANYGYRAGKLAHSLWLQVGAEVGFAGLGSLLLFYGSCIWRLLPFATDRRAAPDPWLPVAARMVIASLIGFAVSAQFVSLKNLEVPFYITLIGAAVLKLCSQDPVTPEGVPTEYEYAGDNT